MAVVVRGPGYGHRAVHTFAHFHSCIGGAPGAGAGAVFSAWHTFTWTDGPPSHIVAILGGVPPLDILIHELVCPEITEEDEMDIVSAETDVPIPVI